MSSLKQLDHELAQLSINDSLAFNQLGEKSQLENKSQKDIFWIVLMNGMAILIINILTFEGILTDYFQIGLAILTLSIGLWAYRRGGQSALLGVAFIVGLWALYYLLIANMVHGTINGTSIIIGAGLLVITLYHVKRANQYAELDKKTSDIAHLDLYNAIYDTLSENSPNSSNNLLELNNLTQKIRVWLRPSYVVILLIGEKRLFFDTTQSFILTIHGQDRGGDTLKVDASIIDQMRTCSISRHGWLRYTQFTR